jgi:hypothetical protein
MLQFSVAHKTARICSSFRRGIGAGCAMLSERYKLTVHAVFILGDADDTFFANENEGVSVYATIK